MTDKIIGRRSFLKYAGAVAAGASLMGRTIFAQESQNNTKPRKALQFGMLPRQLSDADKFKLAKKCGFEGIELNSPIADLNAAKELGTLAKEAGTPIHSVVNGWGGPLSDPKQENVDKGISSMETSLRCASAVGANAVLLVPAVVNEEVGYAEAYERSQRNVRKLLPLAEEMRVVIAVENVWNKFLLSPLEFARYVDEFDSLWLKAYFDVGNVIILGFAQDWIRTLGKRIVKIHLKDFKRSGYKWTNLLDGDVNWPEVRKALEETGYSGFLTPELSGGDEAYLTDLAKRIDRIVAGK